MDNRSYSQRKRDKMDYRYEYFKHNPGLFGCIWSCAYCHRPLVGEHNVQVDHIVPLNNPLGMNARFNLVAACGKCNRNKSDKADGRIILGYISKLLEVVIFSIQKIILVIFVGIWFAIQHIIKAFFGLLKYPFTHGSTTTKIITILIYVYVAYSLYIYLVH